MGSFQCLFLVRFLPNAFDNLMQFLWYLFLNFFVEEKYPVYKIQKPR